MTLIAEVQTRYPTQVLIELSNPRDPAAVAINATKLQSACDGIENGYFPMFVQKSYDSTDTRHVEVACQGVIALLFRRGSATRDKANDEWGRWIEEARQLAKQTGRNRILPDTSSPLSTHPEGQGTLYPDFERTRFADVVPELPPPGAPTEDR